MTPDAGGLDTAGDRGSLSPDTPLLDGVRVVSLAVNLPGPAAAARLVALGASVTKVEPPSGDLLATAVPAYYRELCTGQRVVTLDLKTDGGRDALHALLAEGDLLVTSHRLGALERLGLGWAALHERHPRLSQVAIVGHDGDADLPGHDLTYQASAGTLREPRTPTVLAADLAGAERAAQVAVALVFSASRTGVGRFSTVGLEGVAHDLAGPLRHGLTTEDGLLGGAIPQYRVYPTRAGHVAVAALEPHFWQRLVEVLHLTGDDDVSRGAHLAEVLRQRTAQEWETWAHQERLPIAALR